MARGGWHFVLWGLYFAVLLILEKRFVLNRPWAERIPAPLRQAFTFLLVMAGWGLFSGFGTALTGAMAGLNGWGSAAAWTACLAHAPLLLLCAVIAFAPRLPRVREWRFAAPVLMLLCLVALTAQGYAPFVYFQF